MIDRRAFLKEAALAAAAAGAAPGVASAAQAGPRAGGGAYDVAVVGAGAFGGWIALTLRERGLKVICLDEYGPANPRSSSAGETRSIRSGYGAQAIYSSWAATSLKMWNRRQAEFGRTLVYPNDRVELARTWTPGMLAQRKIFDELKIPYEVLDRAQLRATYPQMNFDDVEFAFIEKSSAAVLKSREAMIVVSEVFQKKGGTALIARVTPGESAGGRMTSLRLGDGSTLSAGQVVFACGPWSAKMFPELMGPKVSIYRSEYYYWGVPAGDDRFSWPRQPAWHDHILGGYGFGSLERGLKYSPAALGRVAQDPDTAERLATDHLLKRGRDYIGHRFPDMRDAPILETRVCQIEATMDDHFVIDRHPGLDNVWLASGGGGHGFKHGPLVGEYVADRVMGRATDPVTDDLFRLASRPNQPVAGGGL